MLVLLAGLCGGVAFGLGLVFLSEPAPAATTSLILATIPQQRLATIVTLGPCHTADRGLSLKQALWKIAHDQAVTRTSW